MSFHVHNSLTRSKELFRPLEEGVVRMYNCGPTVYARQHIGNFRAFLFADVLRRWLEYLGYEVLQVMNITDVGHLVEDEDEGEDKIEVQARRSKRSPEEISGEYAHLFLEDVATLGVREPMARPRATQFIPEMVEMVEALIAKGHAYRVGGDVYFDVSSFPRYGRLSGNSVEALEAGKRVDVHPDKRHPADFALWKTDPAHLMKWETVFGPDGFPGWHIECSAMARKLLGDRIDVHTGGEDNVFPHHECEIAQTESLTGEAFATYWMHTKFLQVDGGKMSKSLGNVYTLDDVAERGYSMRQLRYALIRGHYRSPLNFTWDSMQGAAAELDNLDELIVLLRRAREGEYGDPQAGAELVRAARESFEAGMNDDLNVSLALGSLLPLRKHALEGRFGPAAAADGLAFLERANEVLGVVSFEEERDDPEIDALVAARTKARADKDWKAADRIRDELAEQGVEIKDTPQGVTWRRKEPG